MYYLPINGKYLWKISNCNNLIKEKNIVINDILLSVTQVSNGNYLTSDM